MNRSEEENITNTRTCPLCQKVFPGMLSTCPDDGADLTTVSHDALIGTVFADKYEIQSVLGQGGMSVVYKARHKYMDRTVAVKLLLQHLVNDEVAFKRFQQESKAASSLSHQNIVSVHDFGVTRTGQAYFVMDCVEGASLEDLIFESGSGTGLETKRAVEIFAQVCEGLAHAHKKGIVHRDLKPSNIVLYVDEEGNETVKIVDFGIAKIRQDEGGQQQARLTQTGEVFGSPLYMSPEQCQGHQLDARSDIYSLGCLMYETLTGVTPFAAESFFNMALLHVHQKPPAFSEVAPKSQIPSAIEDVVVKCLAKDPADRFDTAEHVRQKLLDAALVSGLPGVKPGAVPATAARARVGSPLRSTWDSMKAAIEAGTGPQQLKKVSIARTVFKIVAAVFLLSVTVYICVWPGPEGDRGTPIKKFIWQSLIGMAQHDMESSDYRAANEKLLKARELAKEFGDSEARLKLTIEQQAILFHKWDKFAEEEQANKEAGEILTHQILAERADLMQRLRELQQDSDSGTRNTLDQLHAAAFANRVVISSKRLQSRGLFKQDEDLLKLAVATFNHLQMSKSDQMAEFKLNLAECLRAQQRMDEVRPILTSALDIRREARNNKVSKTIKDYIVALMKIGQFDRDESDFGPAEKELLEALQLAEKHFPGDKPLMVQAINSYGDLVRQMGRKAEYEQLMERSRKLSGLAN